MRREANVLVLQDRSIGLESQQDHLRSVQVFPFFSFATNAAEFHKYLQRRTPDVILLVSRFFDLPFDKVLDQTHCALSNTVPESDSSESTARGPDIPIIVVVPTGKSDEGMDLIKRGARDFILESDLSRLVPSIYLALRDAPASPRPYRGEPNGSVVFERATEERYSTSPESLLKNLSDVVTELDITGKILYESPSITAVLGYSQIELIGRNAFSLIHRLDVPRIMPIFMLALANPGIPHSARFRFRHQNGRWRTLESVGKAVLQENGVRRILITSRDVTEQTSHRSSRDASEAQFKAVVEGLGEGLLITDTSDKILYANKRMAEMTGYTVPELLGKLSYKIFLPQEVWPLYMQQKEKWLLGDPEEYELAMARQDGSSMCAHVSISPNRNSDGHITGTLAAFTDITKRKDAEIEIERAFTQLQVAKDHADEMNRLKSSLLSNISHEIRTPLNSILGFASVLIDSLEETEHVDYARTIETSGQRLYQTFQAILDLAAVESKTLELHPEPVVLLDEIRKITNVLEPQAIEKGIAITVELDDAQYATLDAHYFGRVLYNMIANAIKFTDAGLIRVVVDRMSNEYLRIRIIDPGVGISEEFLPQLFREFEQESSGLARKYEGVGLGLRISKVLVERMGGTISVESTKGVGSTFTIALPLHPDSIAPNVRPKRVSEY